MAKAKHKPRRATAGDGTHRQVEYGPLTDYLGYALRRAQMSAVAQFLEAFREVDLRPTQFAVLTIISENPGIRQSEVCSALGIQKANFVPLLNELERRGLALRRTGVADRRSSSLHLTPSGNVTLQRARVLHQAYEQQFVTRLGRRGRDQLLALLNKVMATG